MIGLLPLRYSGLNSSKISYEDRRSAGRTRINRELILDGSGGERRIHI